MSALYVLNFYSPVFVDQLKRGRKSATIRLGDKTRKYDRGQVVWITVGYRHGPREKIFSAVIDDVEVKRVRRSLAPRHRARQPRVPAARGHRQLPRADLQPFDRSRRRRHRDPLLADRRAAAIELRQRRDPLPELGPRALTRSAMASYEFLTAWLLGRSSGGGLGRDLGLDRLAVVVARRGRGGRDRPGRRPAGSVAAAATHGAAGSPIRSASRSSNEVEPPNLLVGEASGELEGIGRWRLFEDGRGDRRPSTSGTCRTTKPWMNAIAPIAAPAFRWNHDQVMRGAARGWPGTWAVACWRLSGPPGGSPDLAHLSRPDSDPGLTARSRSLHSPTDVGTLT